MKMRTCMAVIISALSLVSLTYISLYTSTYEDVKEKIVSVLCLSCIKMEPKTVIKFRFDLAYGDKYPKFVIENLSKGPVFIHFRSDACSECDKMDPVVADIFDIKDINRYFIVKEVNFSGCKIEFIHINRDHVNKYLRDLYRQFDSEHVNGFPMFTVVTLGYDRGFVRPCYATGYGFLEKDSPSKAKTVILNMIEDAVDLYERNVEGFK